MMEEYLNYLPPVIKPSTSSAFLTKGPPKPLPLLYFTVTVPGNEGGGN